MVEGVSRTFNAVLTTLICSMETNWVIDLGDVAKAARCTEGKIRREAAPVCMLRMILHCGTLHGFGMNEKCGKTLPEPAPRSSGCPLLARETNV